MPGYDPSTGAPDCGFGHRGPFDDVESDAGSIVRVCVACGQTVDPSLGAVTRFRTVEGLIVQIPCSHSGATLQPPGSEV
jgi:hypothetical protein